MVSQTFLQISDQYEYESQEKWIKNRNSRWIPVQDANEIDPQVELVQI